MYKRKLVLPKENTETFFLWGPRQTGKTTFHMHHSRFSHEKLAEYAHTGASKRLQ